MTGHKNDCELPAQAGQPGPSRDGLSVVIPAYNEERGIGPVVKDLIATMAQSGLKHEIIVVDDGSDDATFQILSDFTDSVKVLRSSTNRGYGAALKTGIRAAKFDRVCITDADGTYPNGRIPELAEIFSEMKCEMLVGARTGDKVEIPLMRKPAKWVIGKLANFVVGSRIPDINSGMRIFNRVMALRMFPILPDGFSLTTTITLGMIVNGLRVEYEPIDYRTRVGRSKIQPIRDTLNFIQLILRMALYFAPLKVFVPLSVSLFILGIAWAFFSWLVMGLLADVSTLIIIMTAIQLAAIGMLAELIHWRIPSVYRERDRRSETPHED